MQKPTRLSAVDVVRGIAVVLMIATHLWISFFWKSTNPIGSILSYIGGYLSFSIFLIISGFTFGIGHHKHTFKKIVKRSAILVAIYFALGLLYTVLQKQDIFTLFTAPIYLEEYLLTLALFPIVAYVAMLVSRRIPMIKRLLLHNIGSFFILLLGLALVYLGKFTAQTNGNYLLSLILGSTTFHTFPLVSYFVVYGIGIWLGWSFKLETPKNYGAEAVAIILTSTIASLVALPLEGITFSLAALDAIRWPPTFFFITSGLAVSASILYGATLVDKLLETPIGKIFQFIGKYALPIFVTHLVIIYVMQAVVLAKVFELPGINSTPTPLPRVVEIGLTLENAMNTTETWPFAGYKAAIFELPAITATKPYYLEVRPQDIGSLGAAQDVQLTASTKDGGFVKVSKKLISVKDNSVVIGFTVQPTFTSLAVSISDDIGLPSFNELLQLAGKNAKPSGTKLITLDKNFSQWIYRPYSISGKRWFLRNSTNTQEDTAFTAYLPITCDDFEYYLGQLGQQLLLSKDGDLVLPYEGDCTPIPQQEGFVATYPVAKSSLLIRTVIDAKAEAIGTKQLTYSLTFPSVAEGNIVVEFRKNIAISEPMFVSWTHDWEGINGAAYLDQLASLRKQIPNLKVTHFFNPRIWNSSAVTATAANKQITYVKEAQKKYGDEIGLHLHLFTDMVTRAGLTQLIVPGWGNFGNGYDVPLSELPYAETKKLLTWSIAEFKKKGLSTPHSLRAGGWLIDLDNLRAAKETGFTIDSSARTAFSTSFFNSSGHNYKGPWTAEITTQPYWISPSNQNKGTTRAKSIGVFEMPNNGGDSWAYSKETLLSRFKSNYSGGQLSSPKLVTFLSHPDFFNTEVSRISPVLLSIAALQAINDDGPVVFITLNDYYVAYSSP